MQRLFVFLCVTIMTVGLSAQNKDQTIVPTMFKQNKTSIVTLKSGRTVKTPNSNVFLKNGALIYFQGTKAKEARMDIIASVDFDDRKFININDQLAYFVDSIKENRLYCIELIDMDAYERNLRNNVNITNIDFNGELLQSSNNNLNTEEDQVYPIIHQYYYLLDGKFIKAHDRDLGYHLDKERKRHLRTMVEDPTFNWTEPESLMKLLKLITK